MSFIDLLETMGGRLGILEARPKESPADALKVETRTITIEELKMEIRSEDVRTLAELPSELTVPFDKIFAAAGATSPAHGWSVSRLKALVKTEPYRSQDHETAQKAVVGLLSAEKVQAEDLVREAMAQDQALDAFEIFVCRKVDDHMAATQHQVNEVEARIQALQSERARLVAHMQLEKEKLRDWRLSKRAYERELAAAIRYVTDRPVISTDEIPE